MLCILLRSLEFAISLLIFLSCWFCWVEGLKEEARMTRDLDLLLCNTLNRYYCTTL